MKVLTCLILCLALSVAHARGTTTLARLLMRPFSRSQAFELISEIIARAGQRIQIDPVSLHITLNSFLDRSDGLDENRFIMRVRAAFPEGSPEAEEITQLLRIEVPQRLNIGYELNMNEALAEMLPDVEHMRRLGARLNNSLATLEEYSHYERLVPRCKGDCLNLPPLLNRVDDEIERWYSMDIASDVLERTQRKYLPRNPRTFNPKKMLNFDSFVKRELKDLKRTSTMKTLIEQGLFATEEGPTGKLDQFALQAKDLSTNGKIKMLNILSAMTTSFSGLSREANNRVDLFIAILKFNRGELLANHLWDVAISGRQGRWLLTTTIHADTFLWSFFWTRTLNRANINPSVQTLEQQMETLQRELGESAFENLNQRGLWSGWERLET